MNIITKKDVLALIKTYGFTDIDDVAFLKLVKIVETLINNLLDNALYVSEKLGAKTITPRHFAIVLYILSKSAKASSTMMRGGAPVLPSEYFNPEHSGAYVPENTFTPTWVDGLTRGELSAYSAIVAPSESVTGGSAAASRALLTVDNVKAYIEAYKSSHKKEFKVYKSTYDVIIRAVMENLDNLLKALSKEKSKKLTKTLLFNTLKKNMYQFIHMSNV